jgi:hypothetical protein
MGAEPFKDMLMSMRFRFKEDEKIHAQTDLKASELEKCYINIYFRRRGRCLTGKGIERFKFCNAKEKL